MKQAAKHFIVTGLVLGSTTLASFAQGVGTTVGGSTTGTATTSAGVTGTTTTATATTGTATTGTAMVGHSMTGTAAQVQSALNASFDRLFLLKAAQGNMAEVMTSQLALRKARDPQVRQFAQHMIAEHSAAQRVLTQNAARRAMPLPSHVGAMHAATHEQLLRASGRNFDRLYMAAQVEAHENAITLYQQALVQAQDADTRAYASQFLPAILNHVGMVYSVARAVGAPGIADRPAALTTGISMTAGMAAGTEAAGMAGGTVTTR